MSKRMACPFSDFVLKSFARSLLRDNVFLRNTPHQLLSSVPSLAIPMASSSLSLRLPTPSIFSNQTVKNRENAFLLSASSSSNPSLKRQRTPPVRASTSLPPFKLFELPKVEESPSELEPADPDFYRIGYVRSVRAYGIDFMEGPDGFGVYASRDVEPLRRARMIMEIPLELMLTISQKHPWMFFPDIIPIGHPIFDIINSTNPETDWDLRLACLLLYAFDVEGNFWQLYGDFLPSAEECTSFLQAQKEDLLELQDPLLASKMEGQQQRALEFWEKNWHSAAPLKIRRLAHDPERFLWALSIAQSRALLMKIRVGALVQDANMLVPYADMLNHSFQPNCFLHWRFRDRMLEVMINAGQRVKKGDEMTINYMSGQKNDVFMERYGFSSPTNPWDVINFSSSSKIHLDSFLSVFNISGLPEEFYHNGLLSSGEDNNFVNGAVIAAARTLPTWSDGDMPPIPSLERKAARELREECHHMLAEFPTTSQEDQQILDSNPEASRTREAAIKYRLHRKLFLEKVIRALELYQDSILF